MTAIGIFEPTVSSQPRGENLKTTSGGSSDVAYQLEPRHSQYLCIPAPSIKFSLTKLTFINLALDEPSSTQRVLKRAIS